MLKKVFHVVFSSLAIVFLLSSCKKEDKCTGGSGGNLTLKVFMQHIDHAVVNLKNYRDTVYIKYNTKEYPGSDISKYDATIIGEWPGDFVSIPNLQCGDYFIYGVGFESVHSYRVTGGIPFSTELKDGELSVTIPVSE
jgi:hypothetical protein